MKRMIITAGVLVTAFAAVRRFGPALRERAVRKCEEMFDRMPDGLPPKRMMRGIEEIREQNLQILGLLGEQDTRTALGAVD